MSDESKSLELLIKTRAELSGAKDAEAQLERVITRNKLLGRSYEEQEAQLKVVQSALADYANANKDAGEQVDWLEQGHQALEQVMKLIGKETAPELGEALSGALKGPAGIATILGAAIGFVGRMLDEDRQKLEEFHKEQAKLDSSIWDAQREAINKATESAADFLRSMDAIEKKQDTLNQYEREALAVLEAKIKAEERLIQLRGGETPDQKDARYLRNDQAHIDLLNQEIGGRTADESALKQRAEEAQSELDQAKGDKGAAELQEQLKHAVDAQKGLDAEVNKFPDLEQMRVSHRAANEAGDEIFDIDRLNKAEAAVRAAEGNKEMVAILNEQLQSYTQTIKDLEESARQTKTAYEENHKKINDLSDEVKTATAVHHVEEQTNARVSQFGQALTAENNDAFRVATGHSGAVSPASQKLIQELGSLIAGHTVTLQQAAVLVVQANHTKDSLLSAFNSMSETATTMSTFSKKTIEALKKINDDVTTALAAVKSTAANR